MHNPFTLKEEGLFSGKKILSMWLPVLIEQAMITAISIADTGMSAHVGEAAVGAISLITTLDTLIRQILFALAVGGSVVTSQYIGSKNMENANKSVKMLLYCIFGLSLVLSAALIIFANPIITWLAAGAEPLVRTYAKTYLTLTACSFPFFAFYYVSTTTFRAMGRTVTPMCCSILMMVINLCVKWAMIYRFNMGVFGAGMSTLLSVALIGVVMLLLILRKSSPVRIERIFKPEFDFSLIRKVLNIGLPNSTENGMFQFGLLLLQRLTARFGTAALAANAIAKALTPISYVISSCSGMVLVTIVGQCMGAGNSRHAKMYIKYVMKLNYMITVVINVLCFVFAEALVGIYNVSPETKELAMSILRIYVGMSIVFYPLSFVLPQALRGAGDTKFTMLVSLTTMFCIRIGFAYLFGKYMHMGLRGIWIAMVLEWVIKGIVYVIRYQKGKWETIRVI